MLPLLPQPSTAVAAAPAAASIVCCPYRALLLPLLPLCYPCCPCCCAFYPYITSALIVQCPCWCCCISPCCPCCPCSAAAAPPAPCCSHYSPLLPLLLPLLHAVAHAPCCCPCCYPCCPSPFCCYPCCCRCCVRIMRNSMGIKTRMTNRV